MKWTVLTVFLLAAVAAFSQDANGLAKSVKAKLDRVKDYQATGTMKTDVAFMKVPQSEVTVYFKHPDRFRIKKKDGITITPKGGMSVNLNSLFVSEQYTAVPAGKSTLNGLPVAVIKLLPLDEKSDIVVSTLYIDEKLFLIRKATTTTKDNGTYEMELEYGKYADWGLPDKVVFVFNAKEYKLPKGLAFDYDAGGQKPPATPAPKNGKGRIELIYTAYQINKGLSDSLFK
jgi:outer membrane lipoprotein-sorting protein